jgi:hypothetical protein
MVAATTRKIMAWSLPNRSSDAFAAHEHLDWRHNARARWLGGG